MKQNNRNLFNFLIVVVLLSIGLFVDLKGDKEIKLKVTGNDLNISAGSGTPVHVEYKKIKKITIAQQFNRGECISGMKKNGISAGTWRNEQYGEYTLYTHDKIPCVIILETDEGVVVFNYESEDTTKKFYDTLKNYLNN